MRIRVVLTVPQRVLDAEGVIDAIYDTMRTKTAPEVQGLFKRTVEGWHNKPIFTHRMGRGPDHVSVTVYPGFGKNADQYAWVTHGTKLHRIPFEGTVPRSGFLRFQSGYTPATKPRVLSSQPYRRFGPYVKRSFVYQKITAREFDQEIADQYQDTFRQDMQNAINTAAHNP